MVNEKSDVGKRKVRFGMSEDNINKGLAWINTPFSLTKLDKQYTLFQQNVLITTSRHLQKFVDDYFLEKRQLGDARSDFLFEQGVDHAVMNVPPIKVDIRDFATSEQMSYQKLRKELKTAILDMSVRTTLQDGSEDIAHIFSKMHIPVSKNGYTTKDGKKVPRMLGYIVLDIDPKLSKKVFDMGQGYIHHLSMIAKFAKNVNTPRVYIYLLRQIGLNRSLDISVPFLELKSYLGLVELEGDSLEILKDEFGEPVMNKYPKFSQFRKQVLDVVQKDLLRMEKLSQTDIVFEKLADEDFIYNSGKRKGNPDFIRFHVRRTIVGENHLSKDKNSDVACTLNERYKQKAASSSKGGNLVEGDIFAHVCQTPEQKIVTEKGEGIQQWKSFLSLVVDKNQKSLVSRLSFVGMKNNRFCVKGSDNDFEALKSSGLERLAQEYFGCVGSFAPVFYRG